jgi:hypothetical protein
MKDMSEITVLGEFYIRSVIKILIKVVSKIILIR